MTTTPGTEGSITGFHAHVYFDATTRSTAERLRERIAQQFDVTIGRWHEAPVGPHVKGQYEVELRPEQFGPFVSWLMLHREGLAVLVHPRTGDHIADHVDRPVWLGEQLGMNLEFLREYIARQGADVHR